MHTVVLLYIAVVAQSPCTPSGAIQTLVAGAERAVLDFSGCPNISKLPGQLLLRSSSLTLTAVGANSKVVLHNLPAGLDPGETQWSLVDAQSGKDLARVRIGVAPPVRVEAPLDVYYYHTHSQSAANAGLSRDNATEAPPVMGSSAPSAMENGLAIAVASPETSGGYIENIAEITGPARAIDAKWRLRTGNPDVMFLCLGKSGALEYASATTDACQIPGDQIAFVARRPTGRPIVVELELLQNEELVLKGRVTLASRARSESVPVPIADAIRLDCSGTAVKNMEQRGINGSTLQDAGCQLVFDSSAIRSDAQRTLAIAGPQLFDVEVRREGTQDRRTLRWIVPDSTKPARTELPVPPGEVKEGEVFVVSVKTASNNSEVVYRNGTRADSTPLEVRDGQFTFEARLRPKGSYGLECSSLVCSTRAFVTIPVNITGLRFGANPRDLDSSAKSLSVQRLAVRLGLLAALEPWDYDLGRNAWAIPVRLMSGFNFFELGEKTEAQVSFLAGVSLTLPLVESKPQLGTSVALGFFYEADLRESRPFTDGGHFLMTVGLNVLTLLGPS